MFDAKKRKGRKKTPREKETYKFLREKFESAKWFIACIQQRRETLMKIMQAIFERQFEFFEKGPKLSKTDDLQRHCRRNYDGHLNNKPCC